jgi:serine protease Do
VGALVAEVNPGSPAEKAGIHRGDIIIEFNGQAIKDMNELPRLVAATPPGTKASVKVLRNGKEKTFEVTVTELKEERQAKGPQEKEEEGPIGLTVQNLDQNLARRLGLKETQGAVVAQVAPASPAADAGIRPGDVIVEINGQAVHNVKEYQKIIGQAAKGSYARFLVKRQGHTIYFTVEIPS